MSTVREMPGIVDMTGRKVNTLVVGDMVSRHPRPRYRTTCETCGASSTEAHDRLITGAARCLSSSHGKAANPIQRNDRLENERREAAKREAERFRSEQEVSLRKMEADTEGYERPTKYTPTPEPREMSQRERDSLREFREAEEQAERERQRPIREAERATAERIAQLEEEQQTTLRQLHSVEREHIANGKDDEFFIDPATICPSARVPTHQLDSWHAAQSTQFIADNPQYLPCPENEATIMDFIERNAPGLKLLSAAQLTAAYRRLRDFGLLKQRPTPPQPIPETVEHRTVRKPSPPPVNPLDKVFDGWEIDGSAPRRWTGRELERLSADGYRRALRIYKDDLIVTNVGPSSRPR